MSEANNNSSGDSGSSELQLQVRLMNLVMGEASDFERDQLQLLMEQRPELIAYYQHLEHLHGLLSEVGAGELEIDVDTSTAEDVWQLPTDRRERVLAILDNRNPSPLEKVTLANKWWPKHWRLTTLEGVVVASIACVLIGLMLPATQSAREAARQMSHKARTTTKFLEDSAPFAAFDIVPSDAKLLDGEQLTRPSTSFEYFSQPRDFAEKMSGVEDRTHPSSEASLSPKTASLSQRNRRLSQPGIQPVPSPYYLSDDVQYFPASPESELAERTTTAPTTNAGAMDGQELQRGSVALSDSRSSSSIEGYDAALFGDMGGGMPGVGNGMAGGGGRESGNRRSDEKLGDGISPSFGLAAAGGIHDKRTLDKFDHNPQHVASGKDNVKTLPVEVYGFADLAKPVTLWSDTGTANSLSILEEVAQVAVPDASELETLRSTTVNVPNEGTVLLGGIRRDRLSRTEQGSPDSSTLMMTDTPRIIIPEEEEEAILKRYEVTDYNRASRLADAPSSEIAKLDKKLDFKNSDSKPDAPKQAVTLDEQSATTEAFSTFSLHVSDVSFKLAQAALGQGQWPEAAKIRIEEFVNALDYHDPLPSGNQKVACRVEQAIHPFLMQRNLLRVSMRTAATGRSQNTPLRLTLLLDNSGSMERPDRRQAVLRAFQTLTSQLTAADQVTLISFASTPRLLADKVPGNQGEKLLQLIENLPSEGGTNIEAALLLAREKATEQQLAGAQNRIVMLTDGAVNLGNANPETLAALVTQLRDAGIAFDAAGISARDLNDEVLEALTRQGDGRYYLLDSAEAASESFAAQIAGSLRPSAQNVKVQVEFNPKRVGRYKLLGFEKHRLNKEDFHKDQVDAAEMAAAEAGVAVYQFEIKPNGSGDVGSVSVRFRDLATGQMIERRWPILFESNTPRLEQAQASMQLAASAALFAAKLSGGPLGDSVDLAQLQKLLSNLSEQCANQPRVQQLRSMIDQAKAMGR